MDEIDAFAKRLAARTGSRGEHLSRFNRLADTGLHKRSCNVLGRNASAEDPKSDDVASGSNVKVSPPKRQCLSEDKENLTEQRPRGLAALRSGAWRDFDSNEKGEQEQNLKVSVTSRSTTVEDEKPKAKGLATLRSKTSSTRKEEPAAETVKGWDPKVLASLEAQGFSKTPSASKLTYAFQKDHEGNTSASTPPPPPPPPPSSGLSSARKEKLSSATVALAPPKPARAVPRPAAPAASVVTSTVASAAAAIAARQAARAGSAKQPAPDVARPSTPDPSTLSVRERRGLFDAPKDAARPSCPSPAPELMSVSQRAALFEQAAVAHAKDAAKSRFGRPAKRRSIGRRASIPKPAAQPVLEHVAEYGSEQVSSVRQAEQYQVEQVKSQEFVSQAHKFQDLSENSGPEEELSEESYSECEEEDESPEVQEPAIIESSLNFSTEGEERDSGESSNEELIGGKVELLSTSGVSASKLYPDLPPLEDVLGSESSSSSFPASPVKSVSEEKTSVSTSRSPRVHQKTPPEKGQELTHTLSMYRRQQKFSAPCSAAPTPAVFPTPQVQQPQREGEPATLEQDVHAKIRALQQEADAQGVVMAQASQALGLCRSTPEFMGSTEQVEGERLLLLASQRRQACLREVERLKTLGAFGPPATPMGGGTLTLGEVQLPLKRQFLAAQLQGKLGEDVHHFVCLIREGGQLRATQLLSTSEDSVVSRGSLCFSNHMALRELAPDFRVSFLVYALQTQKETVPHDQKYHIRKESTKLKLTPKSKKLSSKHLVSPVVKNSIRTPSFGLVGSLVLSRSNCNHRSFLLDKVPANSPLEGTLLMQVKLTVEHDYHFKGFLSMFEEVRGFGAWHRRWCVLRGPRINCWSYPEDEGQREPIGYLELSECISARPASRDECARPHSFALDERRGGRRLLAADTREERQQWCNVLTDALAALCHWGGGSS
ncbi:anillin-like [Ornithodoros turicata]|uniref:anillin-like n=1 Tax=Ornithodoros turicata TaxID=34597 RepID=UPI00313A0416